MADTKEKQPVFINVKVKVKHTPHGDGNSADRRYHVKCKPDRFPVYTGDAVINYQLVSAPDGIVFDGFDRSKSYPDRQMSQPSISVDGKMMTFSDRNTEKEPVLIILRFRDKSIILYDPEATNDPVAT